ncbi:hypothetical protein DPMN_068869 [Dreissena polymorpha]|uniref:Uncharacterized protein n=1 Tax=Dreissena polymorpha TaxID=45954 RepID=A0A9D3Z1Y5_DREPO|nr:hypothetical protein DPMN_068869 [Dreissena polymorpha]
MDYISPYLYYEGHILGESLHSVKTGNQTDWYPTTLLHLAAQKEVSLQILLTEVVFTGIEEKQPIYVLF